MKLLKYLLPLLIILSGCSLNAEKIKNISTYQVGDHLDVYELEDQHGKVHKLNPEVKFVIISFDMDLSKKLHTYLEQQNADFLENHKSDYIADISEMPAIITKLFAGPRMRRYSFPIIWAREEYFKFYYPKEEEKLTILKLGEDFKITAIEFQEDLDFLIK